MDILRDIIHNKGCNMRINLHFVNSDADKVAANVGDVSDLHGGHLH